MSEPYELNEKDIDSVLNFLKQTDPEHATAEIAIGLLEYMQATVHKMAHDDPDSLSKLYEDFKRSKNKD